IRRRRRKAVRGHDECAGQAPPYREGLSGLGRRIEACPHGVAGASLCLGPCPAAHWRSRSIAMMALTNISRNRRSDLLCLIFLSVSGTQAADLPHFRAGNGAVQLLVHGKPFLIRGGELGNSSAGMAMQADTTLPAMARLHLNTVLVPVAWEQVEPKEGVLDFSILDHWIDIARQQHLHLVLLWFGAWKNAFSEYAPDWVKADMKRFPRAQSAHGIPTEILSTFGTETLRADSRAFRSLMAHLREKDQEPQTVLMVQEENEMGYLGPGRDRSPEADRGFASRRQQVVSSGSPGVDQGEFQGIVGNHLSLGNTCIAVREIGKKGRATGEESLRPGDEIAVGIDPCALAGAAGETSVGISGAGPRSRPASRFNRQEIPGWQRAGLIAADEMDRISVKRIGAGGAAGFRDAVIMRREPDGIDPSAREEAGAIGIGIPTEHDLVQQINSHE